MYPSRLPQCKHKVFSKKSRCAQQLHGKVFILGFLAAFASRPALRRKGAGTAVQNLRPMRSILILVLCGGITATLAARPSRPPVRQNPDDPAVKYTPPPPPGSPGSTVTAGPIKFQPDWFYQATYRKSAQLFAIACYDKDGNLQATLEVPGVGSNTPPSKPAKKSLKVNGARLPGGTFSIRGPAPRAGARYRFTTSNIEPGQRNWDISGDADLKILP